MTGLILATKWLQTNRTECAVGPPSSLELMLMMGHPDADDQTMERPHFRWPGGYSGVVGPTKQFSINYSENLIYVAPYYFMQCLNTPYWYCFQIHFIRSQFIQISKYIFLAFWLWIASATRIAIYNLGIGLFHTNLLILIIEYLIMKGNDYIVDQETYSLT